MLSIFGKKKIVGVDVGTSTIKLVELDVGRSSTSLVSFAIAPMPAQTFSSGDILNPQAVGEVIRQLLNQVKTKRTSAACGLGGSSVIVKRISIPKMDENLISEQIRWEAEQYVPYDINEVNLGYEIIRKSANSESIDLLLIAA
ncbi:MAG: pilus assembly protein PilM, partial [Bdellovibrionota bacterium]